MVGPVPEALLPLGDEQSLLGTIHAPFQSKKVTRDNSETEKLVTSIPSKQMLELLIQVHFWSPLY